VNNYNSGIYEIRCLANNKIYIGSSSNLRKREYRHFFLLKSENHDNAKLQKAFNKYDRRNFAFRVLFYCAPDQLIPYEQMAINVLSPEFNICRVAGSCAGVKRTEETKEKLRVAATGRVYHCSEETKEKARLALKGRKLSEEAKAKLREGWKKRNHKVSEETRQKLIDSHKGQKVSESTKQKLSEVLKGRFISEEHRAKIRESVKKNWELKKQRAQLSEIGLSQS